LKVLHAYIDRQIELGRALPYIALATAPTVTMPRLKALTTGSTPNFLDVVLNFDASSASLRNQDHWLRQLKTHRNMRLAFYGDDTWLKLFPDFFDEHEGTTSFFVADYTEVDQNVTRHLPRLLEPQASWDVLILHYLGVDHIGHLAGPQR
jgi:ethanolaminephosphotransferase